MINPWKDPLPDRNGEYVASCDRNALKPFRAIKNEKKKLQLNVLPEPFIGDPSTAAFVALQLNPGSSRSDDTAKRISSDVKAFCPKHEEIRANLSGEKKEMYWAEPTPNLGEGEEELYSSPHAWYFGAEIKGDSGWEPEFKEHRSRFKLLLLALSSPRAREDLRALKKPNIDNFHEVVLATEGENFSSSLDRAYGILRKKFAVIEYFPYHSEEADTKTIYKSELPSQDYTEHLLQQALDNGAYIFLTRSVNAWKKLETTLFEHGERLIVASSNINIAFTPNNVRKWDSATDSKGDKDPNLFWKVVEKLDPQE